MRSYKKIFDVRYTETGGSRTAAEDARHGTVRVMYKDGTWQEFFSVRRSDYFAWQRRRYDPRTSPAGISVKTSRASHNLNLPDSNECEEQSERGVSIHPRDYIGQCTGFPTPGFAERQGGSHGTCVVDTSTIRHRLGLPAGPRAAGTNEGITAAILRKLEIRWAETLASMAEASK